jgi:hypothetical protein
MAFTVLLCLATIAAAQTSTTTEMKGAGKVTKQELKGEVVYVGGNDLVVKMSTGDVRVFRVPESRVFVVDGKELSVHELEPGTKLTATVTTTMTPVTVRTTQVVNGTVWYVMGNNVILTMPNGENKQFIVKSDTPFTVQGKPATVYELRQGMVVSAEKIVEEPTTEITTDTKVVGQAPRSKPAAQPVAEGEKPMVASAKPALPKTASPLPLIGMLGALFVGASLGIRILRRS